MTTPLKVRSALWLVVFSGIGKAVTGCGSEFTCVDDRSCPSSAQTGGTSGSKTGGSGGAIDSGAGTGGVVGASGTEAGGRGGTSASGGAAGTEGADSAAGSAGGAADSGPHSDAAPDAPSTCEDEKPDAGNGVFVATSGDDKSGCGTLEAPCKTLKQAIDAASKGKIVYVAAGTYEEDGLSLKAGVTLQGGWERSLQGNWNHVCISNRRQAVVIRAKSADRTLSATNLGGRATLDTLSIASKASAAPSQSLYGIFATGSSTQITLRDVAIDVAAAGAGTPGSAGQDGAAPSASCAAGNGTSGANEGTPGAGAPSGSFSTTGYTAKSGQPGGVGSDGAAGTAAPPAPCLDTCPLGNTICKKLPSELCVWDSPTKLCAGTGSNGCGGGGGKGGVAGSGGGSSVGVFLWDATLQLDNGVVRTGRGGDGAVGGVGGRGKAGTSGVASTVSPTCNRCEFSWLYPDACLVTTRSVPGGAAGGPGGLGRNGGSGGGGAGGHSYAVYKGGSAVAVVASGVDLTAGSPGRGGGAAPNQGADGVAKPIGP